MDSNEEKCNEIIFGQELRDRLRKGINNLSKAVLCTMGPMGRTVILIKYEGPHVTKDGVSVSTEVRFKDPVQDLGGQMVKEVAQKTVDEAGDGTTTATCLANSFINTGFDLLESGKDYNYIKDQLNIIQEETIKRLKKGSRKLRKSDIIEVATISANNDREIGKLIRDAYSHSSIIKIEEGKDTEDSLELVNGMELETTYFDKAFINNIEKQAILEKDLNVIIVDGTLDRLQKFDSILKGGEKYLIVADHFSETCLSILKDNHNRGAFTIVPIKSPGFGQHRKDLLRDLATYTKTKVIDDHTHSVNSSFVGKINSVEVYKNRSIITADSNEETDKLLNSLKISFNNTPNGHDKDLLEKRVQYLTGKVSTIIVGGKSEIEMKERKDRIDDAVRAVGAALEEGIVEGGGVSLVRISDQLINEIKGIDSNLVSCLMAPSFTIFNNSGGTVNTDFSESYFNKKIIDPLKVTRCAFQNAISVASTILSTEAVVLNESLWN